MSYTSSLPPFFFFMFLFAISCIFQTQISSGRAVPVVVADDNSGSVLAVIFRIRFKVHILNGFKTNANPLIVSCLSKDDNLGVHTLWQNQEFRFEFKMSFIKTTHFVCNFTWGSKSLPNISVFKNAVEHESDTCKATGNCFWRTVEDGIYFGNDNKNYTKKYGW